jgi:hypothetical protein
MTLRWSLARLALLVLSAHAGCGGAEPASSRAASQDATSKGHLTVVVTVDWEGRDLLDENLAAMEDLRARFPEVPLVQFLNAAYFTKPGADADVVAQRIERALRPDDELGLHIHGWKRLFEAAGVTFRSTPTFWGTDQLSNDCAFDCGHEVPISAYDVDELRQVMRFSVDTLASHGFGEATSFRAGGWMADVNVREALVLEGFATESSAVPADYLAEEIGHLPLHGWVAELWSGTTNTSQPYVLETESGALVEVPDNGALADYVSADEMFDVYLAGKDQWLGDKERDVVVSIGFHQETAARYVSRVETALERMFADAEADEIELRVATAADFAAPLEPSPTE